MSNLEKHLMTAQQGKVLADEYAKSIYAEINKGRPANKPDSKIYSLELDVLEDYLKYIRAEMEKRGIAEKGVQITLGKYADVSKDPKLNPEYYGYQMVFIGPIDLSQRNCEDNNQTDELCSDANLDDVPNLNYMHLSPPH